MAKTSNVDLNASKMNKNESNNEKTDKPSENSLDEIISTIKDKQEEFTRMLTDYTSFSKKTLIDVVEQMIQ